MYKWISLCLLLASSALLSFGGCSDGSNSTVGQPCASDDECTTIGEICLDEECQPDPDLSDGVDEFAADEMGEIDNGFGGADEPTDIGAVIDSFCGIDAYQNGSVVKAVHGNSPYGYKWQCTELAYRFTCQHYNMCEKKVGKYGNAKAWFANTTDPVFKQLTRYNNGGSEPPRPGDVIVWGNGLYGHVAIVKTVLDDAIQVLEQNNYKGSHVYAMTTSGGSYSIKSALGWMRVPGSVQACDGGQGSNPATATLTSPTAGALVEGPFQAVGNASDLDGLQKVTVTLNASLGASVCNGNCAGTAQSISTTIDPAQYGITSGSQITLAVWVKDSLGYVTGPLAVRTITWQSATDQICGDSACAGTETQATCCLDCGCPSGKICQGNACIDGGGCGDGQCAGTENQTTCCLDCGCPSGKVCQGNTCVDSVQCGDGVCEGNENCSNCNADCGCSGGMVCQNGQCVAACMDTYQATSYACNNYSSASGAGVGGGEIFKICGDINPSTGYVTMHATKYDGSTFGNRPYQVRVSSAGDIPCGPDAYGFVVSDSSPSGIGTTMLTFDFQSNWLAGQTEKMYCVTASTKSGDPGYDAGNPQQTSWWHSKKLGVLKSCQ